MWSLSKIREQERKEQNVLKSDPKPKQKIKLKKLQRTHKVSGRGFDKTGYDPKALISSVKR